MLNHVSKLSLFFVFAIAMIVTSCDKEGITELTESLATDTELSVEQATARAKGGKGDKGKGGKGDKGDKGGDKGNRGKKCFKAVYPVTIVFADGTTAEAADKEARKAAVKAWKEANPDAEERPSIAFPFDVQLRDSSIVNIDSEEALAALKETCGEGRGGDRGGRGKKCFKPVFPLTIVLPDGTSATVEDKAGKRAAIQAWKEANPDATGRVKATIGFPVTVALADETQVTLNSQEELDALKATCSEDEEDTGGN